MISWLKDIFGFERFVIEQQALGNDPWITVTSPMGKRAARRFMVEMFLYRNRKLRYRMRKVGHG